MIKVGLSSTTLEPDQAASEQPKDRIPLMAVPITLAIGLLVAGVYVGHRVFASQAHATAILASNPLPSAEAVSKPTAFGTISSAHSQARPELAKTSPDPGISAATIPHSTALATAVGKVDVGIAKSEVASKPLDTGRSSVETAAQDKDLGLIAPQPGERYLQIAAIASHMVPSFLADVQKYNVQASVAPGPHDGLVRIVIGPFTDWDSVARVRDQIQAKWPDCFVRLY